MNRYQIIREAPREYAEALKWMWCVESDFWLDRIMVVLSAPLLLLGFLLSEILPRLYNGGDKERE